MLALNGSRFAAPEPVYQRSKSSLLARGDRNGGRTHLATGFVARAAWRFILMVRDLSFRGHC
jgi:hypothetical protein